MGNDKTKTFSKNIMQNAARYGVFIIFGIMFIIFALSNEHFFTVKNIFLILQQASPLGIGVIGMTFVLVLASIDISVGRNMFFAATIIAYMSKVNLLRVDMFEQAWGYILVCLICVAIGIAIGFINGLLYTKFKITPFIVTLATGYILRGFGLMISGSASPNLTLISKLSNGSVANVPYVLIIFIVVAIIFDFVLRKTPFGRHLMAIGNSPESAKKAGIKVERNTVISFMICGGLGALGGILSAGQIGSVPLSFGEGNEFIIISAAVLGGTSLFGGKGNIIPGAVIGIVLITTIMNGLSMVNASPYIYTIVRAFIIFLAVMVDSIEHKGELR